MVKHGISQLDVDDVNEEIRLMGENPNHEPRIAIGEMVRIGNAYQAAMCEMQEKGLIGDLAPARDWQKRSR